MVTIITSRSPPLRLVAPGRILGRDARFAVFSTRDSATGAGKNRLRLLPSLDQAQVAG